MISKPEYIRQSLELNLFFSRIMKEHLIFMAAAFVPKDNILIEQANQLRDRFSRLLSETVALSNGIIGTEAASSGEIVTQYTLNAEIATQYYTGIPIDTFITQAEAALIGNPYITNTPIIEQRVFNINQQAIVLATAIVQFKESVLANVLACRIFTLNYPLLIDHILREAKFYLKMLYKLQHYEELNTADDLIEQEVFWNRIMAEHAKFIRGLLDPTEEDLFDAANNFANEFDQLTKEAQKAIDSTYDVKIVTEESQAATEKIRDFKAQGTEGLLQCKIKSIILPLLGDHTLREANHYLRLLTMFKENTRC